MAELHQGAQNADQIKHWNEAAGPTWVAQHEMLTQQLRPLGDLAMARAEIAAGDRVLDVGCGCGDTSIEIARRVGPSGFALGVDISAPMLGRAREEARLAGVENVRFELADAQTADLPGAPFDKLFSRFGVMFFSDSVAAFTNLRRALRPGARLTFVCWRAAVENPWLMVPAMAITQYVTVKSPDPAAPGPFAFADGAKVEGVLRGAGFENIALEPVDQPLTVGGSGADLDAVVALTMQMGLAREALRDASDEIRAAAGRSIKDALAPYHTAEGVYMPSASWIVTATAP